MRAETGHDDPRRNPSTCGDKVCPEARFWQEIAESFFAACSFDEFGNLYEVHAGDMREAAERFRTAKSEESSDT